MATTMSINGIDISTYQASFWSVTPARRSLENATEKIDGAPIPIMLPPTWVKNEYELKVNVHGKNRKEIWENASNILQLFSDVADVNISGFCDSGRQRFFMLSLTQVGHEEYGRCKDKWHILTLTCTGYEYGGEMSVEAPVMSIGPGAESIEYAAYVKDMRKNYARQECQMTTVPVFTDITISQTLVCSSDPGVVSGVINNRYPINADIEIYGLCRNSCGKDIGKIGLSIGESNSRLPGVGASFLRISGKTGAISDAVINTGDAVGYKCICDIPSQARIGYTGQSIKIKIKRTDFNGVNNPQKLSIIFTFTPVYL